MDKFARTYKYKLIYVLSMPGDTHKGLLKVGETTLGTDVIPDKLVPNCHLLNQAAIKRIGEYTNTSSVEYKLLYTELAMIIDGKYSHLFSDKDVHRVLMNSGISKRQPNGLTGEEWFETNLEVVKNAIKAVKEGKSSLTSDQLSETVPEQKIDFRDEQIDAIEKTIKTFKKDNEMLWYAKMRFGKTLTSLEVIRRMQFRRVIILTHRPVVSSGWGEDFKKIFYPGSSEHPYSFECKTKDTSYVFDEKTDAENDLKIRNLDNEGDYFIYFASIQDLRGSQLVGGLYNKNNAVFALDWDLIIIDEAHEGTQTELGDKVVKKLRKGHTKVLSLSGTPFNLLEQFSDDNVYTWDYVMEQKMKDEWDLLHMGDHNPYADLPKMHIYTYNLGDKLRKYATDEYDTKAFNFREFFKVNKETDEFVHEDDVKSFLNLMVKEDPNSIYPFSTQEYRDMFKHTLWMVPGVKEARALSELLRKHPVFKHFGIANVAGEGDRYEEEHSKDALELVRNTIKNNDYSITLSCGKLTTGVTVKEWTAVLMLAGSYSTAAAQYMQTIFRVQSAGSVDGKQKTDCYVFDFAPDRTLKVLTETVHLSRKPGKNQEKRRKAMEEFLNYCPVIAISGSKMVNYSVNSMMEQIKHIYAERAVNSGFDDESIYNEELLKLDEIDASKFNDLKNIIGASKAAKKKGEVVVNGQGLTQEQIENMDDIEVPATNVPQLTPEQIAERSAIKKAKENRKKAIDILRGVSIRMPLMIYGADVPIDEDIDIDKFVELVDEKSWEEFMPKGVTKDIFSQFTKYYDRDVFIAAGKRIRRLAAAADKETPTKRVQMIADIFKHFKNPDKETVLTPWRVVNMHMAETLGGWCFFNDKYEDDTDGAKNRLDEPRFVDNEEVTEQALNKHSRVLEINSKSGLYPLYVAYSIYRQKVNGETDDNLDENYCREIWNKTIKDNVYVVCKTPMAKSITNRTLRGFTEMPVNTHYFDDLVNMLKSKPDNFKNKVLKGSYWKKGDKEMKFDAVVGNPPYQVEGEGTRKEPIYHLFYDIAYQLAPVVSIISPARFLFDAGQTPKSWNAKMLSDPHFNVVKYYSDSSEIFPSVSIKGGIAITIRNAKDNYGEIGEFIASDTMRAIINKVKSQSNEFIDSIHFNRSSYRLSDDLYSDYPDLLNSVKTEEKNSIGSNVFDKIGRVLLETKPKEAKNYASIFGRENNQRTYKWIDERYIQGHDNYDKWKLFVAKSNGTGEFGEALSGIEIASPKTVSTQTFISIGSFDNKEEATNLAKYLSSKFARALLGVCKVTPDNARKEVWRFVPLQDFTNASDINWNASVSDIDEQLYSKYGLSKEEILFIDANTTSME